MTDMRIAMFSAKPYEQASFGHANAAGHHRIDMIENRLESRTAPLAAGADAVCVFVNDVVDADVLEILSTLGVRHIALRCAGRKKPAMARKASSISPGLKRSQLPVSDGCSCFMDALQ